MLGSHRMILKAIILIFGLGSQTAYSWKSKLWRRIIVSVPIVTSCIIWQIVRPESDFPLLIGGATMIILATVWRKSEQHEEGDMRNPQCGTYMWGRAILLFFICAISYWVTYEGIYKPIYNPQQGVIDRSLGLQNTAVAVVYRDYFLAAILLATVSFIVLFLAGARGDRRLYKLMYSVSIILLFLWFSVAIILSLAR